MLDSPNNSYTSALKATEDKASTLFAARLCSVVEMRRKLARMLARHLPFDVMFDAVCAATTTREQAAGVFDRVLQDIVQRQHNGLFWGDRMLTLDKCADFQQSPVFQEALKDADSSTGTNQYKSPDGISWRYHTLIWAAQTCLGLPGDFVECGTFHGDMSWMITQTVDVGGAGKKFYLYDTFSGLDSKYSSADDFPQSPDFYPFLNEEYSAPGIEEGVRQRFRDRPFIVVTRGVVPDVLEQAAPEHVAFLHLDMNSPQAETGALEILFDRISPGGIVVFDDYGWTQYHKQKEAADRFMATRGSVVLELPTGQGLAIKR
jgi:O-methyltransferase